MTTYTPPYLGTKELAATFPEAKEILERTIKERTQERDDFLKEIIQYRKKVRSIQKENNFEEFFYTFWAELYVEYFYLPEVVGLDKIIKLSKYQLSFFRDNKKAVKTYENRERAVIQAKEQPIEYLYQFQKPRMMGNRMMAICPFHNEHSPSFVLYIDQNKFHCFGACGASGDAIDFVMKLEHITFDEVIRRYL